MLCGYSKVRFPSFFACKVFENKYTISDFKFLYFLGQMQIPGDQYNTNKMYEVEIP